MTETIVLTGISGFIAKHIALSALNRGHHLRGTLRDMTRADEVRDALRPGLADPSALDRLSFYPADLEQDAGWDAAFDGATALIHCASPFPLAQPEDEMDLIHPAVDGTARVMRAAAAAGVRRVVLTSSTVAVLDDAKDGIQDEEDWCDPSSPATTPYARSKTLAERAAWALASDLGLALTVVNPGLVAGPPLDRHYGSSLRLIERILKGRDRMLPDMGFPVVDVRDVAEMHLRALERPATEGRRYIASAGSMTLVEIGRLFKDAWPTQRIPTKVAPHALVRLLATFNPDLRAILPKLGRLDRVSSRRAQAEMDMAFIPAAASMKASATWLIKVGWIWA
ncbi:NAD-dependent epimerase/dehydratase family protein [Xinfangfangia pollutisoli]|uniref:NAD-dependent epimerase/dehydratase family protein n=1 Tax=Xinfangfangia pollutisoli TaxID=2865960 RepID=UPI001CD7F636|nr:NAD-dependent epimerase/dehydratase family protein [Xinfangfangia pollutisoli]